MKPVLVSGVQPTGKLHIGNYLGALKNFVDLQNSGKYQCYFFIADLHSLTENFNPKEKPKQILNLMADFLATGLDPKKSIIFLQSQISAHSELAWILNTITPMEELGRMIQLKEKIGSAVGELNKEQVSIYRKLSGTVAKFNFLEEIRQRQIEDEDKKIEVANVGLFNYPVLMAADILLYDAKFVPIGNDQNQHLEFSRTLARKFNKKFGKTFIEPQAIYTKTPRIMSPANPRKKMSKSQPESCLFIDDSPQEIRNKIKKAVTDSGSEIKHKENKPAISNLLEIYSALSNKTIPQLEKQFKGKNYSTFKNDLAQIIIDYFACFRKKKSALLKNKSKLSFVLKAGSQKAVKVADKKIIEVRKKVGLI